MKRLLVLSLISFTLWINAFAGADFVSANYLTKATQFPLTTQGTSIAFIRPRTIADSYQVIMTNADNPNGDPAISLAINGAPWGAPRAGTIGAVAFCAGAKYIVYETAAAVLIAGVDQMIGYSFDSTLGINNTCRMYYNGQRVPEVKVYDTSNGGAVIAANTLWVGRRSTSASPYYYDGALYALYQWDRMLTSEEVAEVYYSQGRNIPLKGLLLNLDCQGTGVVAQLRDRTQYNNTVTSVTAPTYVPNEI